MSFRSRFVKHKCQSGQKLKRKKWRLKMVNSTLNMNLIYSPYLLLAIPLLNFWNEGLLSAKSMVFLGGISISLSNDTSQANNVDCFDSESCQLPCPWCKIFRANNIFLHDGFSEKCCKSSPILVHKSICLIFVSNLIKVQNLSFKKSIW